MMLQGSRVNIAVMRRSERLRPENTVISLFVVRKS